MRTVETMKLVCTECQKGYEYDVHDEQLALKKDDGILFYLRDNKHYHCRHCGGTNVTLKIK